MTADTLPTLVLATANPGKIREFHHLLAAAGLPLRVVGLDAVGLEAPPETGTTFAENAILKARNAAERRGLPALADVWGLAVDGLGNIYALGISQDVLVKYDANGAFVDRIAVANRGSDDEPAKLQAAMALATDSRGRIYVADIFGIKVYDSDGQYIGAIDVPGVAFGLAIDDNDILCVTARTEVLRYQLQP